MNKLSNEIVAFATGYNNALAEKVISIENENNNINIRFLINANKALYETDMIKVFANVILNLKTMKVIIRTENGRGSRKYNHNVKNACESLVKIFIEEAQKKINVQIKEENSKAYDQCHIELLSMIDKDNSVHKNVCFEYINQIMDMYQSGASAFEMLTKLVDVKKEMLSDVRLFPKTEATDINQKVENNYKNFKITVNEITYDICLTVDSSKHAFNSSLVYNCSVYLVNDIKETFRTIDSFKIIYNYKETNYWAWTGDILTQVDKINIRHSIANTLNTNAITNRTLQTEDIVNSAQTQNLPQSIINNFSSASKEENKNYTEPLITTSNHPFPLDLQLFSSSSFEAIESDEEASRNVFESNHDTVKIQTVKGEIIARIHPAEDNDTLHKICYSSDDFIYIPDSDIITMSPITYTKSRTKKGVTYRNFGTNLELSYIIETTKHDNGPNINYSNITKKVCLNLNSVFNTFSLWQKQGYKNISIGTIVKQNGNDIIDDYSDTLEAAINNNEMDRFKNEVKTQREALNTASQDIKLYREFIQKYNAESTFKKFIEAQQKINKDASGLNWYEMTLRPLSPFSQPKGHIQYDDSKGRHGIIAYKRELTINELEEYELRKWPIN